MFVRLTTGDKPDFLPLDKAMWNVPPDPKWDFAIYLATVGLEGTQGYSPKQFATERVLKEQGVTAGDSIFTLGLVPGLVGEKRNYPIARQGTLALLDASPDGPGQGAWYWAEAQVYEGNSGGPVILALGGMRGDSLSPYRLYLIGINSAYLGQMTKLGPANIGLQAFTRVDLLLKMMCDLTKDGPPSIDRSDCGP